MAINLAAKSRENLKHAATSAIRKEGFIPSVVYGKGDAAKTVSVESIELLKTLRDEGRNAIITLNIDNGEKVDVMLHDYQTDPVKGDVIHADFYIIDMSEEVDVEVYIRLEGEPAGLKEGGILQQPLHVLNVRSKPGNIPEDIEIQIAELEIGDSINVGDLDADGKFELLDDPDTTVVSVLPPEDMPAETEETEEASVEPELVNAKEDDEDEE